MVITAIDDPFVPFEALVRAGLDKNPNVRFVTPQHGGHCGFISKWPGTERFWAEERIVQFVAELSQDATK
jgi:predicted alpha/beta-fold hydrolase